MTKNASGISSPRYRTAAGCTTTVEMEFFEFGIDLFAAECTCATRLVQTRRPRLPVDDHAAADATARSPGQSAEPIGEGLPPDLPNATTLASSAAAASTTPGATTALRTGLAPELSQWLRWVRETTPRSRANETGAEDSKAAPDIVAYLLTARGELTIAKARRLKGSETKLNVLAASLAWVTHGHAAPGRRWP
ncbi:MAG: hypothetical protein U1F05_03435 [Burkholderiales bacterium]